MIEIIDANLVLCVGTLLLGWFPSHCLLFYATTKKQLSKVPMARGRKKCTTKSHFYWVAKNKRLERKRGKSRTLFSGLKQPLDCGGKLWGGGGGKVRFIIFSGVGNWSVERFLFLHHREKEIGTGKSAAAAVSNRAPASSCLFIARSRVSKPIAVVVGPPRDRSKKKEASSAAV